MDSMSRTVSPFLVLLLAAAATTSAAAFNITHMLEQYPDFSTFNSLLSQTKVADAINSRRTITVLAVDNGAAGALSGRPADVMKFILSVHVILDYFDTDKLHRNRTTVLTTLYQASGLATNNMGFLNASSQKGGDVLFGSMEPGSQLNSRLVKSVVAQPYNISVLQVSSLIVPQGIDSANKSGASPPPPPPPASTPKKAPAPASDKSPAPEPSDDGAPSPSGSEPASAPAADAPSDSSAPADAPAADSPAKSGSPESAPADDSSAGRLVGSLGAVVGVMAVLMALA